MNLLMKNISSNQHGFVKDCSCHTNLLTFYEVVNCDLDRGMPVDVVYFAKTFYTVPYSINAKFTN